MRMENVFDGLPSRIKERIEDVPADHRDWMTCQNCGVSERTVKLRACDQCGPHLVVPVFYCGRKCQKAQWPGHREDCEESLDLPLRSDLRRNRMRGYIKHMERWHHVHKKALDRTLMHALLSNLLFQPHATTVRFFMDTDEDFMDDPPLAWPVKVTLTMSDEGFPDHIAQTSNYIEDQMMRRGRRRPQPVKEDPEQEVPQPGEDDATKIKMVKYIFVFPGGEVTKVFYLSRKDWLAETDYQWEILKDDPSQLTLTTHIDWDLMFLHICASRSATTRGAAIRTALLDAAMETARQINPGAFKEFNEDRSAQRAMTQATKQENGLDVTVSTITYNINPNQRWLRIFKNTDVWNILETAGRLDEIVNSFLTQNERLDIVPVAF